MNISDNNFAAKTFQTSSNTFGAKSFLASTNAFASKVFAAVTTKAWRGDETTAGPYGGEESKSRPFGKGVYGGVRHFKK